MNHPFAPGHGIVAIVAGAFFGLSATAIQAQDTAPSSTPSTSPSAPTAGSTTPRTTTSPSTFGPTDPNPYYIGVSQAITHDSNVFRIPNGPSDNYSSTSLLGGFDQPISRQRVFGRASVSSNRYQKADELNNVSYNLSTGAALETINNISGGINFALNRNLTSPLVNAGPAQQRRNTVNNRSIDASLRYGGASLLTLEGSAGYSKTDYSLPESSASDATFKTVGVTLYYRPGGPLRLGVGVRGTRTEAPQAFSNTATGVTQGNTQKGTNLDFLADYEVSGLVSTSGRISYTKQTNSSLGSDADFSGLTGSLQVGWRPTGKLGVNLTASRDAGYNTSPFTTYVLVQTGTGPILTPVTGQYQNNQITNSLALGATYAATAKVSANAGLRYSRAKLASASGTNVGSISGAPTTDVVKGAYVAANYDVWRGLSASCSLSHEKRDVSGAVGFAYSANTVGCSAQYLWR
ncbi:MAG TPA: hypothetical protein VHM00_14130 [Caldimonas sp.]|jgi:hypothetical protein|nr:hypothetical protein [Caldimonas sp.]HEX2542209.1 hypothetical protein [Caldimonas sp.]